MSNTVASFEYTPSSSYKFSREKSHNYLSQFSGNGIEVVENDDSEDQMVDLSTGSLVPVNLQSWNLMTEVLDKLGKL